MWVDDQPSKGNTLVHTNLTGTSVKDILQKYCFPFCIPLVAPTVTHVFVVFYVVYEQKLFFTSFSNAKYEMCRYWENWPCIT